MAAVLYVSAFLGFGWANYSPTHRFEAVFQQAYTRKDWPVGKQN